MKKTKKQKGKNNNGITLIALIVTIVILLILAGITIGTITGDNGIIGNAGKAKEETEIANEKEVVERATVQTMGNNKFGNVEKDGLQDELDKETGEGKTEVSEADEYFKVTFKDSERSYLVDKVGNVSEFIDISKDVKIGDYVNYKPDDKSDDVYYDKFGETYSGYANGNIGQDDDLKWRVLNINTDGTVDLISNKPTSIMISFRGAIGYNNGVYLLNDYCKTMYSNSSLGAEARSINIEDIQDKMIVNEETGKKAYENNNYGAQKTIPLKNSLPIYIGTWYPLNWKNDKGTIGESKQETLISYETDNEAKKEETEQDLILTQTYWTLNADEMQLNFISADTRDISKTSSMYYELLCNDGNSKYWLASRCVNIETYAYFGLRSVNNGKVAGGYALYNSNDISRGGFNDDGDAILPLVNIKAISIDINSGYDEITGWNLK